MGPPVLRSCMPTIAPRPLPPHAPISNTFQPHAAKTGPAPAPTPVSAPIPAKCPTQLHPSRKLYLTSTFHWNRCCSDEDRTRRSLIELREYKWSLPSQDLRSTTSLPQCLNDHKASITSARPSDRSAASGSTSSDRPLHYVCDITLVVVPTVEIYTY
jgi:hypothetical protein